MSPIPDPAEQPFMPLWSDDEPCAGRTIGLGRSSTYLAAERGEIPTVRFGRRVVVPTAALRRLAQIDSVDRRPAFENTPEVG
jgi:hypothetical protein